MNGSFDFAQDDATGEAEEAAGVHRASVDGSFGYAQDDGGEGDCGVSGGARRYRGMDPSATLRMTTWRAAASVSMLGATAGYAPMAHFYPALSRDPSPRVYSCRARLTNLFLP